MPAYALSDAEADELARAIEDLAPREPPSPLLLWIGALSFFGLHVLLSSMPVRERIIGALGAGPFTLVYSLLIFGSFGALIQGWRTAPGTLLWQLPGVVRWLPNVLMPFAFILLVGSLTTKNPTLAGKPGEEPVREAVGVIRVTRHPMLWAFLS